MHGLHPNQVRNLQILAMGLVAGPLVFLSVALVLRATGTTFGHVESVSYAAVALAIVSPMVAGSLRARMSEPNAVPPSFAKTRAALVVPMAILEAAVFLCVVAFMLTPSYWPLVAAAIPLGTMLAWFPRSS